MRKQSMLVLVILPGVLFFALNAQVPSDPAQTPPLERGDLRAAYELVSEYFATSRVSDGTYARALEFFGERGLVEIIGACGLYGMVSMTLNIFEARIPEGETDPFPGLVIEDFNMTFEVHRRKLGRIAFEPRVRVGQMPVSRQRSPS